VGACLMIGIICVDVFHANPPFIAIRIDTTSSTRLSSHSKATSVTVLILNHGYRIPSHTLIQQKNTISHHIVSHSPSDTLWGQFVITVCTIFSIKLNIDTQSFCAQHYLCLKTVIKLYNKKIYLCDRF
jgi:hypothetical protein